MIEFAQEWFGFVCAQNPAHTWSPAGCALPCCQRCTGLYAGIWLALIGHLWLAPTCTARFLKWHGFFLLLMVPFGFHWVPQGPALRAVSGLLFGAGVATFLFLPLSHQRPSRGGTPARSAAYALLLFAGLFLPICGGSDSRLCATALTLLVCCGATAALGLVIANVWLGAHLLWAHRPARSS